MFFIGIIKGDSNSRFFTLWLDLGDGTIGRTIGEDFPHDADEDSDYDEHDDLGRDDLRGG